MRKFKSLKCPICGKTYKEVGTFGNHMRSEHPGTIPEDWSDLRYAYFVATGKSCGHCCECGQLTAWNEVAGHYGRICGSEACRKRFRERVMAGMRARYGKANLLDDPNFRQRMLTGRKISGEMEFWDGGKVQYMGALEKAFVKMLNDFFRFPSSDIISPSPNRYTYYYENPNDMEHAGMHYYIPDFYIPSCNLEIELKAADNQRPKNLMIDIIKDTAKDIMMLRQPMVNYVKVYETDYHVFFQVFADLAQQAITGEKRPIKYISRSLLTSIYREYIPDDLLAILDQYIYKYYEKSVLKKPANESDLPILEEPQDDNDDDGEKFEREIESIPLAEFIYGDSDDDDEESDKPEDENEENAPNIVGVSPIMYYDMDSGNASESNLEIPLCNFDVAMEAINSLGVDTAKVDGRAATRYSRWRDKLFGNSFFGKKVAKLFTNVTVENGRIVIKGINCNLLLYRIKESYGESRLKYIFEYQYNAKSWKAYQKKKIGRGDMKIDYVYAPEFFSLELVELFRKLAERYHDNSYRHIAEMIYDASWLSKADQTDVPELGLQPLSNIDNVELMDHQKKFIAYWPKLKNQLHMNGYILAFKPGRGKTLTAIGLAECLKASHVYIVCPNNLKENWALEIRKYYSKYHDEKLWMHDVCILGTKYGDPEKAHFIITNNENIKLMQKIAHREPTSMIILDESHNFRNYDGERSKELFKLVETIQSNDILCVSATPIKAVPAEITPVLHLIDPTFTDEAAAMYNRCFNLNDVAAMEIVNRRFGMIIYRPDDVEVELPPRHDHEMKLKIPNEERFYFRNVHDEVIALFKHYHEAWLNNPEVKNSRDQFETEIRKYSSAPKAVTNGYLKWLMVSANSLDGANNDSVHELQVAEYLNYIETYVRPNTSCPAAEVDRLHKVERAFYTAAKSAMGKAVGKIYPARRAEMFISLYMTHRETFYEMIRNRGKKTVIFSTIVPVVNAIAKDLNEFGIKTVFITGATKDRVAVINQFREDPNTMVLVATSWCMGTGFTFNESSQTFFFAAPWRSTDFEQAAERNHRIGQTDEVDIYTVMMESKEPNLSDRMQKILEWSARMFDSAIKPFELDGVSEDDLNQAAMEFYGPDMIVDTLFELAERIWDYDYGMVLDGKIQDPEDKSLYDREYRTLSPGLFAKYKGGLCQDYAAFQDFYMRSHGVKPDIYMIEILNDNHYQIHVFTVFHERPDSHIYLEVAFRKIRGVYIATSLDSIVSYIINNMIEGTGITGDTVKFRVTHVTTNFGRYGETMDEFLTRVHKQGQKVKIRYDKYCNWLSKLDGSGFEGYLGIDFNDRLDSHQYAAIDDNDMKILANVQDAYYDVIKNTSNYECEQLTGDGFTARCDEENYHYLSSTYSVVKSLFQKLNIDYSPMPFLLTIEGLVAHTIAHPFVVVPFRDGALYIEPALEKKRLNNIYYAKSINDIGNFITNMSIQMLKMKEDKCSAAITIYPLSSDLDMEFAQTQDELIAHCKKNGKRIPIKFDPYIHELHRVEVLRHGWTVNRF